MSRNEITQTLTQVFREVFEDDTIALRDDLTAKDVEKWDSISHIDMICLVEDRFKIQFTTREVAGLKNVGELIGIIERKVK